MLRYTWILFWILLPGMCLAKPFDLMDLPPGKNITLLTPATTDVPIAHKVRLSPTDLPQTLSLKAKSKEGAAKKLTITIFEDGKETKIVTLAPENQAFFPFTKLQSIELVSEIVNSPKLSTNPHFYLQISSSKPLNIAH